MIPTDRRFLAPLLLAALIAAPVTGRAQAGPGPAGPGQAGMSPEARDRVEKRLRMARSLGLAEVLDLDEAGTARLNAVMAPYDARRKALLEGLTGDLKTLRQAARKGGNVSQADVDGAVQRLFDARQTSLSIDREMFAALSKGMTPGQVARMAMFFAKFRQRFGMEWSDGPGPGAGAKRGKGAGSP